MASLQLRPPAPCGHRAHGQRARGCSTGAQDAAPCLSLCLSCRSPCAVGPDHRQQRSLGAQTARHHTDQAQAPPSRAEAVETTQWVKGPPTGRLDKGTRGCGREARDPARSRVEGSEPLLAGTRPPGGASAPPFLPCGLGPVAGRLWLRGTCLQSGDEGSKWGPDSAAVGVQRAPRPPSPTCPPSSSERHREGTTLQSGQEPGKSQ